MLKVGVVGLGHSCGPMTGKTPQGQDETQCASRGDGGQQQQARAGEAADREREDIEDKNKNDGRKKGRGQQDGHATQRYTQAQTVMQLPDVGVELILMAHASSLCVPR